MDDKVIERIFAKPIEPPRAPVFKDDPKIKRENRFTLGLAKFFFFFKSRPFWEKHLTTLFYGPRSNGKSLHQAKTCVTILHYLDIMYKAHPDLPQAIMVSNQKFNKKIDDKYLGSRLFYWENIRQFRNCPREDCWKQEYGIDYQAQPLVRGEDGKYQKVAPLPIRTKIPHRLHDAYLIIDDAATIIPADGWQDLPLWFRKTLAQAGHNGVHVIANIQDPLSCDINFRRYVDICFKFNKLMGNRRPESGKPPVRAIWGVYTSREVPADELWKFGDRTEAEIQQMKIDREEFEAAAMQAGKKVVRIAHKTWKLRFHLIRRSDTEIYDTLQNIPAWNPDTMEHREIRCLNPDCKTVHVRHTVV